VLDRLCYRVLSESRTLKAEHEFPCDCGIELRALPERGLDTVPTRFGRDVHLVAVAFLDAGGSPLRARDLGEGADELEVVCGGQAESARPVGELSRCLSFLVDEIVAPSVPTLMRQFTWS
jgi:hypothetical protein